MRGHTGAIYEQGAADTEADTCEVLGAQFFNNIRNTIVTSGAGRIGEFVGTRGDIEIIVEDDDVFRLEFVEMYELTNSGAGSIHERRWFHEEYLVFSDCSLANFRRHFLVMLKRTAAPFFLERVQAEEAGIVSRVCVVVAGVAESDDEFHSGKVRKLALLLWLWW